MDKRIILAKAGAGKTFHICNEFKPENRNLIIAFTNQNISNILNEITRAHKSIPKNTEVMTFHSFIYRTFIRPFELLLPGIYKCPSFRSKGVSFIVPEPAKIKDEYNPKYHNMRLIRHYYTSDLEQIYLTRMSALIVRNKEIFQRGIEYIKKFYDYLYIDEVQDFREFDWKLLEKILKTLDNVMLVGDFFQHSVSGDNNSGIPFKSQNTLEKYKKYVKKLGLFVDEDTLSQSRRCPKEICEFVTKKTGIAIDAFDLTKVGRVREITDCKELILLLKDDSIMKLLLRNSEKQYFRANNWGNSKGDTYDNILVILPQNHDNIFTDKFSLESEISINKLYVALTRTRGDLLIAKSEIFKEFNQLPFK